MNSRSINILVAPLSNKAFTMVKSWVSIMVIVTFKNTSLSNFIYQIKTLSFLTPFLGFLSIDFGPGIKHASGALSTVA